MNTLLPIECSELEQCEAVIEGGLQTFVEVGTALLKIRDSRLYKVDHATFEDYCRERWGFSKVRATQLIQAAQVVESLSGNHGYQTPTTERQARPLAPLDPPQQREAWAKAQAAAPNGKPTARHVEKAVAEVTGRPTPKRMISIPVAATLSFPEPEAEPDPEEPLVLVSPDDAAEYRYTNLDNTIQKVLEVVSATEDYGIDKISALLTQRRRLGLARSIDNLTSKLAAWSMRLKGEQS